MISAAQALALTRIGFGLYFIAQAWDKLSKQWLETGEPMAKYIQGNLPKTQSFYRPFLQDTVLPNAALFSQLVTIGELVAGVLLLLGLFTRLGALVGMWLTLNYMLTKGLPSLGGSVDRLFFLTCLAFLLGSAGLVWGLDGMLRGTIGRIPVLGWLAGARGRPAAAPAS